MTGATTRIEGGDSSRTAADDPQEKKRINHIPEALLLAGFSASAYLAFYFFELGRADAIGYPAWMISVDLTGVLTMAAAIARWG